MPSFVAAGRAGVTMIRGRSARFTCTTSSWPSATRSAIASPVRGNMDDTVAPSGGELAEGVRGAGWIGERDTQHMAAVAVVDVDHLRRQRVAEGGAVAGEQHDTELVTGPVAVGEHGQARRRHVADRDGVLAASVAQPREGRPGRAPALGGAVRMRKRGHSRSYIGTIAAGVDRMTEVRDAPPGGRVDLRAPRGVLSVGPWAVQIHARQSG